MFSSFPSDGEIIAFVNDGNNSCLIVLTSEPQEK